MSGSHSILAPSGSARWLRCVGSLYLSKGVPNPDTEHSASGTFSHYLLEEALNGVDVRAWLGLTMTVGGFDFKVDEERLERVQSVVDNINREPGLTLTETLLDTTPVLGVPHQSGHSDIIKADADGQIEMKDGRVLKGVLSVHDFKDGYLLVNAKDNTQGLIYLCAALFQMSLIGEFEAFRFCIHQPKIRHYDEWVYTRAELEAFMALIRPVAKLAYDIYHGHVEFDPVTHLNAGEEQCAYCPVRGKCVARAARISAMFEPMMRRHELDDASVGLLYAQLDEIEAACGDFRAEALTRAKIGANIVGHKLVYGNKGKRRWADPGLAEPNLTLMLGDKAYAPREVISPTEAEKLLKKSYGLVEGLVTQSDPQLRLVPVSHKGEPVVIAKFEPVTETRSLI